MTQELLLTTLEDLIDEDLDKFQWYLTLPVLVQCKPFQKSHVHKISRTETVSKITESYGEDVAVTLTIEILKKMRFNNAAKKLKDAYTSEGSKTARPPTSSSPLTQPSASGGIAAQRGGVVMHPVPLATGCDISGGIPRCHGRCHCFRGDAMADATVLGEMPRPIVLSDEMPRPIVLSDEMPRPIVLSEEMPRPIVLSEEIPWPMPLF